MTSDQQETRAQILHAARNHPGYGHTCAACLAEAAGERRQRGWWHLAGALLAVAVVVVMCGVVSAADADVVPLPGWVTGQ